MEFVNIELLAEIAGHGDFKILLNARKVAFALLNVEHADLERAVFGLDGTLERTIPGYVKPGARAIELRLAERFPSQAVRKILAGVRDDLRLASLRGFRVRYGREDLGEL